MSFFAYFNQTEIPLWQSLLLEALIFSILLPLSFYYGQKLISYFDKQRASKVVFREILGKEKVKIFVAQLQNNGQYWASVPHREPGKTTTFETRNYSNILNVWSEGDGKSLSDVFNLLGRLGKKENIVVADLAKDWDDQNSNMILIGFNEKTKKMIDDCSPIYFRVEGDGTLKIDGTNDIFTGRKPNDHFVIQKTFNKYSQKPVIIMAGQGVEGTSSAGFYLKKYISDIGKMYGAGEFCLLFRTKWNHGREAAELLRVYPKPKKIRILFHPILYKKKYKKFF